MNMSERARRNLKEAISEVLETMYFLCLEPGRQGDVFRPGDECISVRIETAGEARYAVELRFTEALLRRISRNVLEGAGGAGDGSSLRDLALETANMVGGAFLNRFDPDRTLLLELPQWIRDPSPQRGEEDRNLYLVEGEPLWVSFGVQDAAGGVPEDGPVA